MIYDDDSRLHIYEFLIACFFIVELFLRVFAFETKHLFKSWSAPRSPHAPTARQICARAALADANAHAHANANATTTIRSPSVQLFDSCIVIVAFSLSVFAISTPILAARSARILLLLRGGSRVARAVTRTRRNASRGERERRDGVEMQGLSHLPKDAVAKKLEPTIPAYIKLTDPLRAAIDRVLADPDLPQADREALVNSRFGYYDAQENHSIAATSASALRVLSARLRATEGEGAPRLCDLLRGSSLVFPLKKL